MSDPICSIIVPTCKNEYEIAPMISEMQGYAFDLPIITTCTKASAAVNRNIGLEKAQTPMVIMVDDDCAGFYPGWYQQLIKTFNHPNVVMVSARLIKVDGGNAGMMFPGSGVLDILDEVPAVPTACIAFRKDELRFDERFLGSQFEDTFYMQCLRHKYPQGKIVIHNACRIIHLNEAKGQSEYYGHNKDLYDSLLKENGWSDF